MITNNLWKILCSVKGTLFLLILLAFTSIFGTVIPQNENAVQIAETLSPALGRLFIALRLYDMYYSPWFRLIILFLAINLIACSIDRLPGTLKLFRLKAKPDREKPFENLPENRSFRASAGLDQVTDRVRTVLIKKSRQLSFKKTSKANWFYIDKGRYSLFGVYLVHLSVIFILAGAVYGSLKGFKGYVNILEGEAISTIHLRRSEGQKPLGFNVHCDEFGIDFYDNGMPKEYRSSLRFTRKNRVIHEGLLRVNHPITFEGITFYQASYGSIPGDKASVKISYGSNGDYQVQEIQHGVPMPLPEGDGEFMISAIRDDFMRMGHAVSILIRPFEGETQQIWIFKDHDLIKKHIPDMFTDHPRFNPSIYEPYTFSLENIEQKYFTGIQVNKDPGVPLVYAGFLLIIIGCVITFFQSRRRIWVRVLETDNNVCVQVAGSSNKNPFGLERELDQIIKELAE